MKKRVLPSMQRLKFAKDLRRIQKKYYEESKRVSDRYNRALKALEKKYGVWGR